MITTRPFIRDDFAAVREIYRLGIATGNATFQQQAKTWEEWDAGLLESCRLVAVADDDDNKVIGWAALAAVSPRPVYGGVAEVSIYIDPGHSGRGAGSLLLTALVRASESAGFWTLQAGIFPENTASIALHAKCGFVQVGRREKIGRMENGKWRDVVLMERRSKIIGV